MRSARSSFSAVMSLYLFALLTAAAPQLHAAVKPNGLFVSGAVLQQGASVPVWGTAAEGERVTVTFQGQICSTVARDGRWMVRLEALPPGGPSPMTIAGDNTIELHSIMVGEVWVASGQSNMVWPVNRSADPDAVKMASKDPLLRLYVVPGASSATPSFDVGGRWREAGPSAVGAFSAVAYFFGRDLRNALGVPVGIIQSAVGATAIELWTRRSFLESDSRLSDAVNDNTGTLYNGMVAPLLPYPIRGVIWYQGESNAGAAYRYRTLFPAMIRNWRQDWGEGAFPFLFVQLAPFRAIKAEPADSAWAELREAQLLTTLQVPRTAIAVITDVGDENDIHPKQKEPVGARLALAARHVAYGQRVVYSGPIYRSMQVKGPRVIVSFDHVGAGLVAKGGPLTGFAIAGEDRQFVSASAAIEGREVVVWSPLVAHPTAVRFGWADYPVVNLYSQEGLPASPFRTDDFPMVTAPK